MTSLPDHAYRLIAELRRQGPSTAQTLGRALGVSQPTVARAISAAEGRVARVGRARRTRYVAVRDVRGLGSEWPLYRIDDEGRPQSFGRLAALHGGGSLVTSGAPVDWWRGEFVDGLFPGIPWFLDDQRPQGFLGRQFAQRWSRELGLSPDILLWDDDTVLAVLLLHGDDGIGNFVLGERMLERALQAGWEGIPAAARHSRYAALAEGALAGEPMGSSAAGEQPKFTATVDDSEGAVRHVIVKFSEPVDDSPTARRWADLLVAEHLAGELLAEQGHPAARSDIVWSQGRLCLEVTRFDRVGKHGRRGCVTLAAWSDAHDGIRDHWAGAAARMQRGRWLADGVAEQVRLREWFGRMIANTDMHFGNLSFFLGDALPLRLAPSYDMLPMLYRPAGNGALVERVYQPAVPTPDDMPYWRQAAAWAQSYWQRVSEHADISAAFRQTAAANGDVLLRARRRFDPGAAV